MVNANNLELQCDKIFVDPQTKRVMCIFWPVVNNQRYNPPHLFLKQIPQNLKFAQHESSAYIEEYKTFFRGSNPFSINSFDRLILRLLGKQISGYGAPSESLSGTMSGNTNSERKEEKVKKTVNIEYDPTIVHTSRNSGGISQHETGRVAGFVSCASCGGMNHVSNSVCVHCGAVQREKTPSEQAHWPVGLVSEYGAVPPGNNSGRTVIPTLISVRTKESCAIRKPIFTIGGKESGCDLIVNNPYISRNHADILMRNGKCYIVDKNSKNKTYVNGEVLPAGKEVEIVSGTQIRLANEDFYFQ